MSIQSGSIRYRTTALATIIVGVVLTAVALATFAVQRHELFANLDDSLEQRADTYQTAFEGDDEVDLQVLQSSNEQDRAAQLLDSDRQPLLTTANLKGSGPIGPALPQGQTQRIDTVRLPQIEDDTYRVVTRRLHILGEPGVLHVAQTTDDLNDIIRGLLLALMTTVPLAVALLATLVWRVVGRTLEPVEQIRAEVDDISGTDFERRLEIPEHADEIKRLATTMNDLLDRIEVAGHRQREFVSNASHELRTPLTRIRTEIEVDLGQPHTADPIATHQSVRREILTMQNLIDDLLFLARTDEQRVLPLQPIDLDDIVLEEVRAMGTQTAGMIDTSNVTAAHLDGNTQELRRLVQNLLSNSTRHAESSVTVSLRQNDGGVVLTVEDDGAGVPDHAHELIFERFWRAQASRSRIDGGFGLGLAIVRSIAERHRGSVHYDRPGLSGARFIVNLPTRTTDA